MYLKQLALLTQAGGQEFRHACIKKKNESVYVCMWVTGCVHAACVLFLCVAMFTVIIM